MKIKVILLDTIKGIGKKDEIVEVKDGYANNFLFPSKKGVPATPENLNKLRQKGEKKLKDAEKEVKKALELKEKLDGKSITLSVKSGENGKVFGSIGSKEIIEKIKQDLNYSVDKKQMPTDVRIKEIGIHKIVLKLHNKISAEIKVTVVGV